MIERSGPGGHLSLIPQQPVAGDLARVIIQHTFKGGHGLRAGIGDHASIIAGTSCASVGAPPTMVRPHSGNSLAAHEMTKRHERLHLRTLCQDQNRKRDDIVDELLPRER